MKKKITISLPAPSNLEKETAQLKVIQFLRSKLSNFNYSLLSRAEEDISQELTIYLQREAISDSVNFFFKSEYKEDRRKVDFGVIFATPYTNSKAFFVIEAKRLTDRLPRDRKKEYVRGNYGGIERFKKNKHGKGLSQSAIVGYVQDYDFSHWHTLINSWIQDAIQDDDLWKEADKLQSHESVNENSLAQCNSVNLREDGSTIKLTHLWIEVRSI